MNYETTFKYPDGITRLLPPPLATMGVAIDRYRDENTVYKVGEPGKPPFATCTTEEDALERRGAARRSGLHCTITRVPPSGFGPSEENVLEYGVLHGNGWPA